MKIFWFSNIKIESNISSSGTWINSMAHRLMLDKGVELFNITEGITKDLYFEESSNLKQWILPKNNFFRILPNQLFINKLQNIINEVKPDVIHIWGTENYWGLLFSRGLIKTDVPIILEIQGFKYLCASVFFQGISIFDYLKMISLRDLIKPRYSVFAIARRFKKWEIYEKEIIKYHSIITFQSDWVKSNIRFLNNSAKLLESYIQLRENILNSRKWDRRYCIKMNIFTSMASLVPYKGFHVLLDAIFLLKSNYPEIKLHVACGFSNNSLRQSGYERYIFRLIKNMDLENNIVWLGNLNADDLLVQLLRCNVYVMSSFVESYSLALKEALYLGVPTVSSFVGATPEHAINNYSCLFYNSTDSIDLASKIEKYFDLDYAESISNNILSSKELFIGCDDAYIRQINTYRNLVNNIL